MTGPHLGDFPSLERFGTVLVEAQTGQRRRLRLVHGGAALLPLLGLVAVATASTAAGLTVLTGSPIPATSPAEDTASIRPAVGTGWISDVRDRDPAGGPPWSVRVARGDGGSACVVAGQVHDGAFGIVGHDRRFRALPDTAGGCAAAARPGAPIVAMRAVAARRFRRFETPDGYSVLHGVGGAQLAEATVRPATGAARRAQVGRGGTFVAVLDGLPDQAQPRVVLRWRDGTRRTIDFRRSNVVPDPLGGRAWPVESALWGPGVGTPCVGLTAGVLFGAGVCGMPRRGAWLVRVDRGATPVVRPRGPRIAANPHDRWRLPSRTFLVIRAPAGARITVEAAGRPWPVRWAGGASVGGRRRDSGWVAVLPPGIVARDVRVRVSRAGGGPDRYPVTALSRRRAVQGGAG